MRVSRCARGGTGASWLLPGLILLSGCWADFPESVARSSADARAQRDAPATEGVAPPAPDRGVPGVDLRRADGPVTQRDQRLPVPDRSTPPPDDSGGDAPLPTSTLAQICTGDGSCPPGETCVFMDDGATKGVCLVPCTQPNTMCATPDPQYISGCIRYTSSISGTVTVCMVLCRFQGQTYPCPSPDHYCKSYGPGLRVCAAQN